jgi:hypothetical protein
MNMASATEEAGIGGSWSEVKPGKVSARKTN